MTASQITVETEITLKQKTTIDLPQGKVWEDVENWCIKWNALHITWCDGAKSEHPLTEIEPEELAEIKGFDAVVIRHGDQLVDQEHGAFPARGKVVGAGG